VGLEWEKERGGENQRDGEINQYYQSAAPAISLYEMSRCACDSKNEGKKLFEGHSEL
jgi:hypothetical protein